MKASYGFRDPNNKIKPLLREGKKRTGLGYSYLIREGLAEGLPIVISRFTGSKKPQPKKFSYT